MAFHTPPIFPSQSTQSFRSAPPSPFKQTPNTTASGPIRRDSASFQDVARETSLKLGEIQKQNIQSTIIPQHPRIIHHLDTFTTNRVSRASNKLSEYLHHLSNEPSIGLFHVTEHISRTVPKNIEMKSQLRASNRGVEDMSYDVDSTLITIKDLGDLNTFTSIKGFLTQAIKSVESINKRIPYRPPQNFSPVKQRPPAEFVGEIVPDQSPTVLQINQIRPEDSSVFGATGDSPPKEIVGSPHSDFEPQLSTTDSSSPVDAVFITTKPLKKKKPKVKDFTMKKFDT